MAIKKICLIGAALAFIGGPAIADKTLPLDMGAEERDLMFRHFVWQTENGTVYCRMPKQTGSTNQVVGAQCFPVSPQSLHGTCVKMPGQAELYCGSREELQTYTSGSPT